MSKQKYLCKIREKMALLDSGNLSPENVTLIKGSLENLVSIALDSGYITNTEACDIDEHYDINVFL